MCLILCAIHQHPEYKLIIAANRDEFYERPTQNASFWEEHPDILAGRDLQGGGTWLGVHRSGKLSMLTNFRDPERVRKDAPTRGKLVSEYLIDSRNPRNYIERVRKMKELYNGFNLLLGTVDDLWHYSNISDRITRLGSGIYGLSNSLLNIPWPKVEKGKETFERIIQSGPDPEQLFKMLTDSETAPDEELPDTGVGMHMERLLSPLFIKSSWYGTRNSTLLMADHDNTITFMERVYDLKDFSHFTNQYTFTISS